MALTNEGGQANLLVVINGQSTIFTFPKNSDESYVRTVVFWECATAEMRLTAVLIAEVDKRFSGAEAHLNLLAIDTDAAATGGKRASRKSR